MHLLSIQFINNQSLKRLFEHIEVSLFHVAPWFYYLQIQFLQKDYLGMVPVFPGISS